MFFRQCFTDGAADVSGSEDQAIVPLAILGVHQVSVDLQILHLFKYLITGTLLLHCSSIKETIVIKETNIRLYKFSIQ